MLSAPQDLLGPCIAIILCRAGAGNRKMAYLSKENKKVLDQKVRAIAKKHGLRVSTRNDNYSSIVLTVRSGGIDFVENYIALQTERNNSYVDPARTRENGYIQVNNYHLDSSFTGTALEVLKEFNAALHSNGWYDRSDAMTDYFDTAWYVNINIGAWDKPYILEGK